MKLKQPEFLHEFLVTHENHISVLGGLDILTDQKCILDLNERDITLWSRQIHYSAYYSERKQR